MKTHAGGRGASPRDSSRFFRLTCAPAQTPAVEALLRAQGFVFDSDPVHASARVFLHIPFTPGASLAARFGLIYLQDRSSMLPPLALAPEQGDCVLDMCASPGGKSGMLALAAGRTGFVAANEPSPKRLAVLRANLTAQNLLCCATASCSGERFPIPAGGIHRILLDPPCSGWGTAEKHPGITALWRGDKIRPLLALQRRLLTRAAELLSPGGRLVYSTCTTNREENEEQLRFACDELGLALLPAGPCPQGFAPDEPAQPRFAGVWKVRAPQIGDPGLGGQGFFVGCLGKSGGPTPHLRADAPAPDAGAGDVRDGHIGAGDAGPLRGALSQGARNIASRAETRLATPALPAGARDVARGLLAGPYVDPSLLPPGQILLAARELYFLPASGAKLIEAGLPPGLRGFPLGRLGAGGETRLNPRLRVLMPAPRDLARSGVPFLSPDEPEPLQALVSGQALRVDPRLKEIGLYFQDIPLCRLTVKGGRALLPGTQR
ncbi:MAG: RsmB/NOP family class I SAM-dependent RNA methyltransferase [Desulfovibrio sp.]|nr:RsmB/NOP family class I SAM-dependent RNA methyltransferase [Desulfovibrio sp.]